MSRRHPSPRRPSLSGPVSAGLLAGLFLALTVWSWRKWGDVFIDFGHELYIPWQLSEGRVLYRDIAYFMGPLSQYGNALLFRVFGVSFTTLIVANLVILAGITAGIHRIFEQALGRTAATFVCAVFLAVFGFGHYVRLGNYNYVTPYLHEQTHGVALGVLLLVLLASAAARPSRRLGLAAGLVLGLAFLTKAEAFVPALACALTAGVLLWAARRPPWPAALGGVAAFAAAALLPVSLAFLWLWCWMPAGDAARGLVGNWIYVFDRDLVLADPYYAKNLGLRGVGTALAEAARAAGWIVLFAAGAVGLEYGLRRSGRDRCVAASVLVGVALAVATDYAGWMRVVRPLPLVCAAAAVAYTRLCWRRPQHPAFRARFALALWSVFSVASLGKMILRTRIEHYGFALAMPGTLLLVALVVFVVPDWLRQRGWRGEAWRAAFAAATMVAVGWMLTLSHLHYRAKTVSIGSAGDRFHGLDGGLHHSGIYFSAALDTLAAHTRPGDSLVVLPDGVLLNYLLRRPNPTPYYLLTPWEMRAFGGEETVLADIARGAPDCVVIARLDMGEYGPRFFGFDDGYGRGIHRWLEKEYELLADIGDDPETGQPWLQIYRRRPDTAGHRLLAEAGAP